MKSAILCTLSLMFFIACHQDSDEVITVIENPDPPTYLISTRLVSFLDNPPIDASPATLLFAGQTESLDDFAFQQISSTGINRDYELIQLVFEPNLPFYKVSTLIENDVNYSHLMIPELTIYDGIAANNTSIPISPGENLIIPADNLLNSNGTTYQGSYKVYYTKIDPAGNETNSIPSFTGINASNVLASLVFGSCYYVRALSSDDEELTFGNEVHITAPHTTIPQWTFDHMDAIWVPITNNTTSDAGKIQLKSGGYYAQAQTHHLTRVKGTLTINGSPTPHYPIAISYEGQQRVIQTTNSGSWAIQLPSETTCEVTVALPCGDAKIISLETSADADMATTINVTDTGIENVQLLGTTRDCAFNPLSNNYTIIEGDVSRIIYNDLPEINFSLPACANGTMIISSLDPANKESGPAVSWAVTDTVDIHSSLACDQAKNEYLSLVVSGEKKMYWNLTSEMDGDRLTIGDDGNEPDLDFKVFVEGLAAGTYSDNMLNILFEDMHLGNKGYSLYCPTASSGCGFTSFTITHFPEQSGQWIRGHFEGRFWIKTFNPLTAGYRPVEGEFQVYREF